MSLVGSMRFWGLFFSISFEAILRETLRLSPTATARSVVPKEDIILHGSSGDYAVKAETPLVLQVGVMMRDPKVWGEDVSVWIHRSLTQRLQRPFLTGGPVQT